MLKVFRVQYEESDMNGAVRTRFRNPCVRYLCLWCAITPRPCMPLGLKI